MHCRYLKLIHGIVIATLATFWSSSQGLSTPSANRLVYLLGEDHYGENERNIQKELIWRAGHGELIYFREGILNQPVTKTTPAIERLRLDFDDNNQLSTHVLGIEELTLYTLTGLIMDPLLDVPQAMNLAAERIEYPYVALARIVRGYLGHLRINKSLRVVAENAPHNEIPSHPILKDEIKTLGLAIRSDLIDANYQALEQKVVAKPVAFLIFMQEVAKQFVTKNMASYPEVQTTLPDLPRGFEGFDFSIVYNDQVFLDVDGDNTAASMQEAAIETVAVDWRNHQFAKNIDRALKNDQPDSIGKQRPAFVQIGANHIEGLQEELTDLGYQVKYYDLSEEQGYSSFKAKFPDFIQSTSHSLPPSETSQEEDMGHELLQQTLKTKLIKYQPYIAEELREKQH